MWSPFSIGVSNDWRPRALRDRITSHVDIPANHKTHWHRTTTLCAGLLLIAVMSSASVFGLSSVASAQTLKTLYVSSSGSATTTCTQSKPCKTIQDAVSYAESTYGSTNDVIIEVAAGTYDETDTINASGLQSLAITGAGTTVNGEKKGTVFTINGGTVSLTDLTITGGLTAGPGGGISNSATLTLSGDTVSSNTATGGGGGISNTGTVTLISDTLSSDSAGNSGGGGGAILNNNGTLTMSGSTVTNDTAKDGSGGGIFNVGTISLTNDTLSNDIAGSASVAGNGGAILNDASAALTDDTLSSDSAPDGGGGGISNGGTLTLTDDTLTLDSSGGTAFGGGGGALYDYVGTSTLTGDTLSNNSASLGGAVENDSGSANVTFGATIVADNTGGNCNGPGTSVGYNLTDDNGISCQFEDATDVVSANPDLGSLASNGGPTKTLLPAADSPAVGVIPLGTVLNGLAVCPSLDQRGILRPASGGSACSIGAVEPTAPPKITSASSGYLTLGYPGTFKAISTGNPTPTISIEGTLPPGIKFKTTSGGMGTFSGTPTGSPGNYSIAVIARNGLEPDAVQLLTLAVQSPSISGVTFSGNSANPTVTVTGNGFGSEPTGTPAGCSDPGKVFGTSLWFDDVTGDWNAGLKTASNWSCIGLVVHSYTDTKIIFTFASFLGVYALNSGDDYSMNVLGQTYSGTVAF
jgi:hypothetical protein